MRIGFDFNGVVINNTHTKTEVAKKYLGLSLRPENTTLATLGGAISRRDYEMVQDLTYGTSELLSAPPHSDTSRYYLERFMQTQEVFIVSRIQPRGVQFGKQWLREHWIKPDSLVSVGPGGDKRTVLRHNFDVYIDDDPEQLKELEGLIPNLFLINTPANRTLKTPWCMQRVNDWQELDERIAALQVA
jgi:uncharacterized HAD superfamily protein